MDPISYFFRSAPRIALTSEIEPICPNVLCRSLSPFEIPEAGNRCRYIPAPQPKAEVFFLQCLRTVQIWKKRFAKKSWSTLADRLLARLNSKQYEFSSSEQGRNYKRDNLTDKIIEALDSAGRVDEKTSLCTRTST